MLPPWNIAPSAANTPMKKAARIVGSAFAPTAGANGGEFDDAPSAHAIPRLAITATTTTSSGAEVCKTGMNATTAHSGVVRPRRATRLTDHRNGSPWL